MRHFSIAATAAALMAMFTQIAPAADLARKAPAYAPPAALPVFTWTGCYVGIEGGGSWGHSKWTALTASNPADVGKTLTEMDLSGGLFGGTVGCNYQFAGNWVIGIENDISWTNKKGSAFDIPPFNTNVINTIKENWLDTLRGRIGFTWDRIFIYGTGGVAFAAVTATGFDTGGSSAFVSESHTRTGWTAGAGVEWAFLNSWSVKVEYLHVDLGKVVHFQPPVVVNNFTFQTRDIEVTNDIVRAGLNYRFY
jgi:outer membrane immunogenic protein